MIYLLVGLGGMIGAGLRYSLSLATACGWPGSFPLATLIANWAGCFLLPFLTFRLANRFSAAAQKGITTGVIGSFTTFSTFSVETVAMWETGQIGAAFFYVFLSLAGGLLFVQLGVRKGMVS